MNMDEIKIMVYPKRDFDDMVRIGLYGPKDSFISINFTFEANDPVHGLDLPVVPDGSDSLILKFDDVSQDQVVKMIGSAVTHTQRVVTKEQANEMIDLALRSEGRIHVHCQMGKSRSVAVGTTLKTILEETGKKVSLHIMHQDPTPNRVVKKVMLDAWDERKEQAKAPLNSSLG